MLKFNSLLIFSEDPSSLGEFYEKVFEKKPGWDEGGYKGFDVGGGSIMVGPHDKVHGKNPNSERIMFNLETDDVEKEFERIKALGAEVIAEPYHPGEAEEMWLSTFADPDGNYFQLASPMPEDMV
jgi:predicted enzyme related to lactoylglutathione lyase